MNRLLVSTFLVLAVCAVGSEVRADTHGDVNFLLGQKQLEDDALEPNDEGGVLGAVMSFADDRWPVHVAVDVIAYGDDEEFFDPGGDEELSLGILEVAVGIRKIWQGGPLRPYLGGGIESVAARFEEDGPFFSFDDDEGDGRGLGVWAGGGIFWRMGEHFNLGFDLRWNRAEIDVDFDSGAELDDVQVGGLAGGLTLGFGW